MEYCSHLWGSRGNVVIGMLDKIQSRACGLINIPIITNQLPELEFRRDVTSLSLFYRYFYGNCSDELHAIIPSPLLRGRLTRGTESAHSHSLTIPSGHTSSYKKSFLPRLVKLWNSLPQRCFPDDFNLQKLKRNVAISFFLWGFADSV